MSREHVTVDELVAAGVLDEDARDELDTARHAIEHTPIYMQLISGVGGLFASLFFVSFVLCASAETTWGVSGVFGLVILATSLFIRHHVIDGTHPLAQALISARLTGAGLTIASVGLVTEEPSSVALTCLAICMVIYPLERDHLMRFIATCAAYLSITTLFAVNLDLDAQDIPAYLVFGVASLSTVLVLGRVATPPSLARMLEPFGYASACVTLVGVSRSMFDHSVVHPAVLRALLVLPMLVILARAWSEREPAAREPLFWAAGAVAFLALLTNTGLLAGLLLMLLGAYSHRRPLIGLGVASLFPFLSHYYYWLDVSLLAKSCALMATGVFFFALRALMRTRPWMRSTLDAAEAT